MFFNNKHKAFTMLELIFVIVIMGIIGKFGVEFMAKAYETFIFSNINNGLQSKSAAAVELIGKRLEHRIKASVISRNTTTNTINSVDNVTLVDNNATVLEWISTDIDGFRGLNKPNWSGVIDLNATNINRIISPSTETNTTNALIIALSDNQANINNAAIYYISDQPTANPWGYLGALANQQETLQPINSTGNINEFAAGTAAGNFFNTDIYEYYKLTWTAYAVELENYNDATNIGDLVLYYNYRPWEGDVYNVDGTKVLLAEDVNTFRYRAAGSLIKIQVCAKSALTGRDYALCKEKSIY